MKVSARGKKEMIDLPDGQSFRMIRWRKNLKQVESLQADGSFRKISGEGVHWHHHMEMELTFFTKGSGTRFVGDHIGEFAAGELVLLGSGLPHYWHAREDCAGVSVQWHFPDAHALWGFREMMKLPVVFREAERGFRLKGKSASSVATLLGEMLEAKAGVRLARLLEVFSLLAAMPTKEREMLSSRGFAPVVAARHQQSIAKAVKHLLANFRGEIRVEDLLKLTGMSRATFARQFKLHAGRTSGEFVNKLRIQAACRELSDTEKSVTEIAMNCGFGEISFFNRLFRREKGCSPREWRGRRS